MSVSSKPSETETKHARLLVVDDDPSFVSQLRLALGTEFEVQAAGDVESAWQTIQDFRPELITLDLALDGSNPELGFGLLQRCTQIDPYMKILMITGNDTDANALRAVDHGAADFLGKPVDVDELRVMLRRLRVIGRLQRQNAEECPAVDGNDRLGAIIGASPQMRALFESIRRIATADVSGLVLGESGTGKELVVREIRRLGPRSDRPFVSINCGAIPENLLESELFGHEKGAFTGAHATHRGLLERADGGIVFLDEVAELPTLLQVKLLRFLQDHKITRLGGGVEIPLDVRVIAATNRDPEKEVESGRLRADLYYRLSVVTLWLPPLRDRQNDILLLAQYFLSRFCEQLKRGRLSFSARARTAIRQYAWPGNVRELEHAVQKGVVMASGSKVDVADLGLDELDTDPVLSLREARRRLDREMITKALRHTAGNVSEAARLLDVARPSLHEIMQKHDISADDYRTRG